MAYHKIGAGWMLVAAVLSLTSTSLQAQQGRPAVFVGAAVGGGTMPGAYRTGCFRHDELSSPTGSTLADLRVGVRTGPVTLETRATGATGLPTPEADCEYVEPRHESGTHTDRLRGVDAGEYLATDLRVRFESSPRWAWVATAGAGFIWSNEVPFLLAGVGLRTPGRLRGAIDMEWNRHRVPFDVVTRDWADHQVVREVSQQREHEWQAGWSLRLGAEFGI